MDQKSRRITLDRSGKLPFVSVIVPMRNEEKYIGQCLNSLSNQDYDHDCYEILVLDGKSTDNSWQIVEQKVCHSDRVRLLTNPHQTTPHAFNRGIQEARGDLCIIFSAHAYAAPDFISKSVYYIRATGADCVGGRVDMRGENDLARAVAKAVASAFGMGNVYFRSSNRPGFVDTVSYCTYRKEIFEHIGLFDVELIRNQDYELNYRVRKAGGQIFFAPDIEVSYYSRSSWRRLIKQYFQYGFWKVRTVQKHPGSIKLRHIIPPIFVEGVLLTMFGGFLWWPLWIALGAILGSYVLVALFFSLRIAAKEGGEFFFLLPLVFAIMHFCWGTGFIWGVLTLPLPAERVPLSH